MLTHCLLRFAEFELPRPHNVWLKPQEKSALHIHVIGAAGQDQLSSGQWAGSEDQRLRHSA